MKTFYMAHERINKIEAHKLIKDGVGRLPDARYLVEERPFNKNCEKFVASIGSNHIGSKPTKEEARELCRKHFSELLNEK